MQELTDIPKFSRYAIESTLGSGGMGTVYLAYHEILERPVALKVPHRELANNDHFVERFLREAKALGTLHHRNIVTVYDAGIEHDTPYIAMKYVAGETLSDLIRMRGQVDIADVLHWGRQMADALSYLHDQNILHRDLKSANVMIDSSGDAIIADFGIAQIDADSNLTRGVLGTPSYMSPEQAMGKALDARSDMHGFGVILYQCLTGELPFRDENSFALLQKVIHHTPTPIRDLRPDTPEWLDELVNRCLKKHPGHRFKNDQALLDAFDDGLTRPIPVTESYFFPPARKRKSSNNVGLVPFHRESKGKGLRVTPDATESATKENYHRGHTVTYFEPIAPRSHSTFRSIIQHGVFLSMAAVLALVLVAPLLLSRLTGMSPSDARGKESLSLPSDFPASTVPELPATNQLQQERTSSEPHSVSSTRHAAAPSSITPPVTPSTIDSTASLVTNLFPDSLNVQALSALPLDPKTHNSPTQAAPSSLSDSLLTLEQVPARHGPMLNLDIPELIISLTEHQSRRSLIQSLETLRRKQDIAYGDKKRVSEPDLAYIFLMNNSDDGLHSLLIPTSEGWTDVYTGTVILEEGGHFFVYDPATDEVDEIKGIEPIWVELWPSPIEEESKERKRKATSW